MSDDDLAGADLPLESHLWVKRPGDRRWGFYENLGLKWFDREGKSYTPDQMRVLIHDGARVRVAMEPETEPLKNPTVSAWLNAGVR